MNKLFLVSHTFFFFGVCLNKKKFFEKLTGQQQLRKPIIMKLSLVLAVVAVATMVECQSSLEQFGAGNLKFTSRLYNEILKQQPNKNFVFSPLSIEIILALTRAGAKGLTASEVGAALNLPNEQATEEALKHILPALKTSQDNLKLLSANQLFIKDGFQILDSFKNVATNVYEAGIQEVNFNKAAEAAHTINQWVERQTNSKIQDLISPDSLDGLTRLVLVNALYFSGQWETAFSKHLTKKQKFYLSNTQTKEVDMMYNEDSYRYYESAALGAKFLELPYSGANITMTIVLPNEKEGLTALEKNVEALLAPQNLQYENVAVSLPRFLVQTSLPLKQILQNLGLNNIFSDNADLSGIAQEALKVDDVVQKAFINVTESGTEAAAATAVHFVLVSARISRIPPVKFIVDRPFFYCIKYNNVILFTGKVQSF